MKKRYISLITVLIATLGFLSFNAIKHGVVFKSSTTSKEYVKEETNIVDKEGDIKEEVKEQRISNITLLSVGDIMFHSPQFKAAYDSTRGVYDFTPTFKYVKKYISGADIALGNFETVTAGKEVGFKGYPNFNSPRETLYALKDTGFDILSTANNHSLDQGKNGLISTIDAIEEYGLKNIGTYKEPNTPILVEEVEGIKLGFLCYTYGMNGMDFTLTEQELSYMINKIDENKIKEDIESVKSLGVDVIVVFIHWGNEYQREPSTYQMDLGRKMVEWGANIILGSHPHVIQKTEIISYNGKDNFIIYSMGNFLSNQRKETMDNVYTEDGIMVQLELEKDFSKAETTIKNITYIPTWVHKYRKNNQLFYEILPIQELLQGGLEVPVTKEVLGRIERSYKDTMDKITQN
ncbi:CapA family protein [Tissierella sp. MSJ-40]|uniref:CapA family protein n=1 Tax=Tissierella simiarum TaxID=2841534 RepID=A0ABS6E6K8_9FIRM|nr:CapA family protein [Tissierella simiarum]MBU5438547.1 CapA family protein [Tissierella simiarum]